MDFDDNNDIINERELRYIESHEYDEKEEQSKIISDKTISDNVKLYFREISKYPLLTKEQEVECAKLTINPQEKHLLEARGTKGRQIYNLDIPLLFNSLCDTKLYNVVINSILKAYNKLKSRIQDGDILFKYQQEANKLNRALNKEELKKVFNINTNRKLDRDDLIESVKDYINYRYGFDMLLVSNLRLVVSNAVKYHHISNLDLTDIINEGNIGLINAINKYDVSLGFKFSTYAVCCIRQPIRRAISNYGFVIRIPEGLRAEIIKFKKRLNELEQEKKKELLPEEVAEILCIEDQKEMEQELGRKLNIEEKENLFDKKIKKVREYYDYLLEPLYLDQAMTDEEDATLGDLTPSKVNVENEVLQHALREEIEELFMILTPREKLAVKMRWGVCEYEGFSFSIKEISKAINTSESGVGQVLKKAHLKMSEYAKRNEKVKSLRIYND